MGELRAAVAEQLLDEECPDCGHAWRWHPHCSADSGLCECDSPAYPFLSFHMPELIEPRNPGDFFWAACLNGCPWSTEQHLDWTEDQCRSAAEAHLTEAVIEPTVRAALTLADRRHGAGSS